MYSTDVCAEIAQKAGAGTLRRPEYRTGSVNDILDRAAKALA
jgi:hypothetical protein